MKTQNPWMGRARGSAGNMTSSKVYDKNVMRAKAFEVNNPKTAAQTNERNFFAEVQKVCQTVSKEQLHSLFGVKPKSMSRRTALISQMLSLLKANKSNIEEYEGEKFSLGNGEKVTTPVYYFDGSEESYDMVWDISEFGNKAKDLTSIVLVVYNITKSTILIINIDYYIEDTGVAINTFNGIELGDKVVAYATCSTDGSNVINKPIGSFTIKTRAV